MAGGFSVPLSSSLPATPDRPRRGQVYDANSNLSTTPAAPPPSTANSFTPAGPPPSSIYGSSQLGSSRPVGRQGSGLRKLPDQRPEFGSSSKYGRSNRDGAVEDLVAGLSPEVGSFSHSQLSTFDASLPLGWQASTMSATRSTQPTTQTVNAFSGTTLDLEREPQLDAASETGAIARDIARQLGTAELLEPNDLILETEELVSKLNPAGSRSQSREQATEIALSKVPGALCQTWDLHSDKSHRSFIDGPSRWRIGPADDEQPLRKATFVGSLLLRMFHPPLRNVVDPPRAPGRSSKSLKVSREPQTEAQPKVLLDWLNEHHDPYSLGLDVLKSHGPECTANANYWDVLSYSVLRGRLAEVIDILKVSDFVFAHTAKDDNRSDEPYTTTQLESTNQAVEDAVRILDSCPAQKDGDWDMSGPNWRTFRARAAHAVTLLSSSLNGRNRASKRPSSALRPSDSLGHHRLSTKGQSEQGASSELPRSIYQSLKALYTLLSGMGIESVSFARDWLEAAVFLAVWSHGEDVSSSDLLRSSRHHRSASRSLDLGSCEAYRHRLANAFDFVLQQGGLQINTNDPVEVGAACAVSGSVEGALELLRSWSLPVAAAVVEVAATAGWLPKSHGNPVDEGFDESDLMVLNYTQPDSAASKDGILLAYANALFLRGRLSRRAKQDITEGWEIGMRILSRLDDQALATTEIGAIVQRLAVDSSERADKTIKLCRNIGLDDQAVGVAERYADGIAESTDQYGAALVYYAYAHSQRKVRDVLELLISYCLVHSTAYPPLDRVDGHLLELLEAPRSALSQVSTIDPEAAAILSTQMSGYATLRNFYQLRDKRASTEGSSEMALAQKRSTTGPLLAVIASAADNVQGGLYDRQHPAVVPVEGLLVLLGEASVLVKDERQILTLPQMLVLLRAIEDLETVHPRLFSQCDDCLASTLASGQGATAAEPRDLLKKSISDVTASSGFSLVGSSMQESSRTSKKEARGDGKNRGWDWRQSVPADIDGRQLLADLRLVLAKAVGDAWIDGDSI